MPLTISSPQDLRRTGLSHLPHLSRQDANLALTAQFQALSKYQGCGLGAWWKWRSVPALLSADLSPLGEGFSSFPAGYAPPLVLLPPSQSTRRQVRRAFARGYLTPTDDPLANKPRHESMHLVAMFALSTEPVVRELNARLPAALKASGGMTGVSLYAAENPHEFLTEALTEWNTLGERSGLLSTVVGTTVDRYLAMDAPGALRAAQLRAARYEEILTMPPSQLKKVPIGSLQVKLDDIPEWEDRFAAIEAPMQRGMTMPDVPVNPAFTAMRPFELHQPQRTYPAFFETLGDQVDLSPAGIDRLEIEITSADHSIVTSQPRAQQRTSLLDRLDRRSIPRLDELIARRDSRIHREMRAARRAPLIDSGPTAVEESEIDVSVFGLFDARPGKGGASLVARAAAVEANHTRERQAGRLHALGIEPSPAPERGSPDTGIGFGI